MQVLTYHDVIWATRSEAELETMVEERCAELQREHDKQVKQNRTYSSFQGRVSRRIQLH